MMENYIRQVKMFILGIVLHRQIYGLMQKIH